MKKKGILKSESVVQKNTDGLKWDEKTIEFFYSKKNNSKIKLIIREHDKERGQYPKITEPKTPYCYENEAIIIILIIYMFKQKK